MNWPKIVTALRKRYTLQEIADRCDMSKGAVHDLGTGRAHSVLYERGVKIVALHRSLRGAK